MLSFDHQQQLVKMRWIGPNGIDITEDRSQRVHTESAGPHGHRLIVMHASVNDDNGLYKCTLGGEGERVAKEVIDFTLKIYKSIDFKNTRSNHTLINNGRYTLACSVDFDPNAQTTTVTWLRDKKPIETYNDPAYSVTNYNEETQTSLLTIAPITRNHNGIYTCRATAVTTQLSQIKEHDMRAEVQYAPIFDQKPSVIWVERRQPTQSTAMVNTAGNYTNSNQMDAANTYSSAGPAYPHQQTLRQRKMQHDQYGGGMSHQQVNQRHQYSGGNNNFEREQSISVNLDNRSSIVKVTLTCTCQANPPAAIVWTSPNRSGQKFLLSKDNPSHILEQPVDIVDGYNTTSVLVIGYDFDPQWPYKQDVYTCLASNILGQVEKKFSVAEGILPPAFPVAPTKRYDAKTFQFEFTILPLTTPSIQTSQQQQTSQSYIVPPVDMFRIRTFTDRAEESDPNKVSVFSAIPSPVITRNSTGTTNNQHQNQQQRAHVQNNQMMRHNNDFSNGNHQNQLESIPGAETSAKFRLPQNYSVSLSMLPAGTQKLYLEAHNAVGWSPNSTYLGDYYIVSGTFSLHQQIVLYTYSLTVLSILATLYHQSLA